MKLNWWTIPGFVEQSHHVTKYPLGNPKSVFQGNQFDRTGIFVYGQIWACLPDPGDNPHFTDTHMPIRISEALDSLQVPDDLLNIVGDQNRFPVGDSSIVLLDGLNGFNGSGSRA